MEKMATKHYSLKKMLTIISLILLELLHDTSAADKKVKREYNCVNSVIVGHGSVDEILINLRLFCLHKLRFWPFF